MRASPPDAEVAEAGWHNGWVPTDSSDPTPSTPDDSAEIPYPVIFRINRVAYFTVPMVALVVVLLLGASYWFAFLFVVPVALYMWIHRLRTVVTEDGLSAVGGLSTTDIPLGRHRRPAVPPQVELGAGGPPER